MSLPIGVCCEMMAHMAAGEKFEVWAAIRTDVGPAFVSWFVDLSRTVMLWVSIGAAHLLQLLVLSFGWAPTIVHYLDFVEECLMFSTVAVFLLMSTVSFVWATWRRTARGLR